MTPSAQHQMIETAIKRGRASRGNRRVEFEGTYQVLPSFELGNVPVMTGRLTCWYYSSPVFCVDFDNKRITDFGMIGYSVSTSNNIRHWKHALSCILRPNKGSTLCIPSGAIGESGVWTAPAKGYQDKQGWRSHRERFKARAPWCYQGTGMVWWFDWELFDPALNEEYYLSIQDLARDQNWRYYAYFWDAQGKWSKRFIDDDAKRRFLARQKKKQKGASRGNVP